MDCTKDLRYDSKDSRDIEKGSFSFNKLRWFEDIVDVGDLCQNPFFSGGDGFGIDEHSADTNLINYRRSILVGKHPCH